MKKIQKVSGGIFLGIIVILLVFLLLFGERNIPKEKLKEKYCTSNSSFMSLMGMQVHYRMEGNPLDTLPILLIHGTSSSLHTWDSLVSILTTKQNINKRIIRVDLPAFGLTGPSPENKYDYKYYNQFLDSFLNRLHINKCIIAGNSLGGGIAWHYALAQPKKVNKLILIDASGYPLKNEKGSIGFKLASIPIINNLLLFITPKSLVKKSLEDVFYDKSFVTEDRVTRYHELLLCEGNRKAALSIFKNRQQSDPTEIKNISTPTLIIWGDQDQVIAVENAYLFKKDIKNSQLLILSNIGHVPMEEAPDKISEAFVTFIK